MRMNSIIFVLFLLLIQLSGCAASPPINWNNPQEVIPLIDVEHDASRKLTIFTGPDYKLDYDSYVCIRAWKSDTREGVEYQIYVSDTYYYSWKYYHTAYDSAGNELNFIHIARDLDCTRKVTGCEIMEVVGLNTTRSYLEKHAETGLDIKVSGKAGELIFSLPGGYIRTFLDVAK